MKRVALILGVCAVAILSCLATAVVAEDKKSDEIKIDLKAFKFKAPSGSDESMLNYDENEDRLCYYIAGPAESKFKISSEGEYDLVINASGDKAMDEFPKFSVTIDDNDNPKEVSLKTEDMKDYKLKFPLKAGEHKLVIAFLNDTYKEGEYDSNLYVHGVKLAPHKADSPK